MVCNSEPAVVNHGVLCRAIDCGSWFVLLSQWLLIMVYIAEQVIVNHGEFYCASGCESWCVMLNQWL
jgi:hypothetical protein